jgi:hypothetical protein
MHTSIPILTFLPVATASIFGTCTPKTTHTPELNKLIYPTTLTEVHSCTLNWSAIVPPFFDRTQFSNHEQTLTTLQPLPREPTSFPYTHVVTVKGVLSRTEWVGGGLVQTTVSTVTDVDTAVWETGKVARAKATPM